MLANSATPSEIIHFVASHQGLDSTYNLCYKQNDKIAFLSTVSAGHCAAIRGIHRPYLTTLPTTDTLGENTNHWHTGWRHEHCCNIILYDCFLDMYVPRHEISNNAVCATCKNSDQTAHTRSLIRAFASRLNIQWISSYQSNIILSF